MKSLIPICTLVIALIACKDNTIDSDLEIALKLSGDNREELETVLANYANDAEKLAAAKFLIANMPGHFSYAETDRLDVFYDALDSMLCAMQGRSCEEVQSAIISLYKMHRMDCLSVVPDIKAIKSDFLISNIDRAFEQWKTIPWCRNLNFEQFCEFLLPYKVAETQSLRPWWNDYDTIVADSLKRMSSCSLFRISAFQATEVINNALRRHFSRDLEDYEIPKLFYRPLTRLRVPFGTCDELCQAGLTAFRASGVPVAIDYVPVWGYGNKGHSWAVVHSPNGKDIPFVPVFNSPTQQHKINETVAKAYRRTYARNKYLTEVNSEGEWVPRVFRNVFQRDITSQYADVRDITVDVPDADTKYVYLCTSCRSDWTPVAVSKVNRGKVTFADVGRGCVLLVVSYDSNGNMRPLSKPLKLDRDGTLSAIEARQDSLIDVKLFRKAPLLEYAWNMAVKVENGVFEAADNPDFKDAMKVGEVDTSADQTGEIEVDAGAHRYWRYIQRGNPADCYIGEITMLSQGRSLNKSGTVIGNYPIIDGWDERASAFDGDVLAASSFTCEHEAWVGLDFGEPVPIDRIIYSPRSDGDMIEPGDEYELMYWHGSGWKSLGRKIAPTVSIDWSDVPAGGVYILLNRTKGNSVRIFLIDENGHQEWW